MDYGVGRGKKSRIFWLGAIEHDISSCNKLILSGSRLLLAAERIKWPMKVDYESSPATERKDFENTFTNLLKLQTLCVNSC